MGMVTTNCRAVDLRTLALLSIAGSFAADGVTEGHSGYPSSCGASDLE